MHVIGSTIHRFTWKCGEKIRRKKEDLWQKRIEQLNPHIYRLLNTNFDTPFCILRITNVVQECKCRVRNYSGCVIFSLNGQTFVSEMIFIFIKIWMIWHCKYYPLVKYITSHAATKSKQGNKSDQITIKTSVFQPPQCGGKNSPYWCLLTWYLCVYEITMTAGFNKLHFTATIKESHIT